MPTTNALVLIGNSTGWKDGVSPYAVISVKESGRFFAELNWLDRQNKKQNSFLLLLDPEYGLDDLLLIVAYAVEKIPVVCNRIDELTNMGARNKRWIGMNMGDKYDKSGNLGRVQRRELHALMKEQTINSKLTFVMLADSALPESIAHLEEYPNIECEVVSTVYKNTHGFGSAELFKTGSLEKFKRIQKKVLTEMPS